ncbi:unnamed protein product [Mytilus coruscus]|uniref:Uncharacterized protein n=1 Tax=Mytilus coruscus TaxID=42192 RepID=A0A6J8A824_MYTCO|nr:unnamed protein product [Mytilus coruscus]
MTMKLNDRLKSCAEILQDKQLLSKLSTVDVIAQDMKYLPAFRVALYNKERAVKEKIEKQTEIDAENEAGDVALVELVNYIFEIQRNSDGTTTFRLADLANMYERRVQQLNKGSLPIHRTRLKERLLAKISDLPALLAFEKDAGLEINSINMLLRRHHTYRKNRRNYSGTN